MEIEGSGVGGQGWLGRRVNVGWGGGSGRPSCELAWQGCGWGLIDPLVPWGYMSKGGGAGSKGSFPLDLCVCAGLKPAKNSSRTQSHESELVAGCKLAVAVSLINWRVRVFDHQPG